MIKYFCNECCEEVDSEWAIKIYLKDEVNEEYIECDECEVKRLRKKKQEI